MSACHNFFSRSLWKCFSWSTLFIKSSRVFLSFFEYQPTLYQTKEEKATIWLENRRNHIKKPTNFQAKKTRNTATPQFNGNIWLKCDFCVQSQHSSFGVDSGNNTSWNWKLLFLAFSLFIPLHSGVESKNSLSFNEMDL